MTGTLLGLVLSYAVVAALLLNLNLSSQHGPWIKTSAIVLVTGLYAGTWVGAHNLLGWASPAPLADNFRVLWITLEDPDKVTGQPGAIYYWVRELDDAALPIGEPRAHKVPWSEASAEAAEAALQQMEEGQLLNGRMSHNQINDSESTPPEGTDYAGEPASAGDGTDAFIIEFSRVPSPTLPAKGTLAESPAVL